MATRKLRDDAYGIVALKDQTYTSSGFKWAVAGYLELVQQEEFDVTKLSDSSWALRVYQGDHEMWVLGCQVRSVEVLSSPESIKAFAEHSQGLLVLGDK